MRKLLIWFISLIAVLAVYLLVTRISKTPPLKSVTSPCTKEQFADSNVAGFSREDSMHFEVSQEMLEEWRRDGKI